MKRHIVALSVLLAVLAVSCARTETDAEHHDEKVSASSAEAEHGDDVLRIEKSMLRDLRITTAKAEQRIAGEAVSAVGEIHADQTRYAEVGTPVTARVTRVLAVLGQNVGRGQILAEAQSVELGRARAEYASAEARVSVARSALERKRALADRIVPRREVEQAAAELAAAEAELRAAAASLQAVGASPSSAAAGSAFALTSPMAGTVLERNVARGQMIDPEHVAFRLADLGHVWLVAHVFERDAVRVQAGEPARVTLAAFPGQTFTGTVSYIGNQVESASRTIPIRVDLPNPQQLLKPGMSATAWFQVSSTGDQVVTVPAAAVQRVKDQWVVFVPRSDQEFEIRSVGRGRDLEGEVEILNGLQPGETVVVDGAFLLKAQLEKAAGGGDHHGH